MAFETYIRSLFRSKSNVSRPRNGDFSEGKLAKWWATREASHKYESLDDEKDVETKSVPRIPWCCHDVSFSVVLCNPNKLGKDMEVCEGPGRGWFIPRYNVNK